MGAVTTTVYSRNGIGQFKASLTGKAERTVQEAIKKGADRSRALAPVGPKADARTLPLKASIYSEMVSRTAGRWGSSARHAASVEFGAGPHTISGSPALSFFWESEGRQWIPAEAYYHTPGLPDLINHPGNPAQPFLRPAYREVSRELVAIARRNFST